MTAPDLPSPFSICPQPTPTSCGPTCLSAIYAWYGEKLTIHQLIKDVPSLPEGGTLGTFLGNDALRRGFGAHIFSWNLHLLDPSWFKGKTNDLSATLQASIPARKDQKEQTALAALATFLELGGKLSMEPLTRELIRRHLLKGQPILTGLSSTFLYEEARLSPATGEDDDLGGQPEGHFVVCHGYARATKTVTIHDPYSDTPFGNHHRYEVHIDRLITAILLGVLTYDANLIIITPRQ